MNLERIGKYEVISTIGRGSMGLVYKAQDPEIGRLVAIKTLRSMPTSGNLRDHEMLERFRIEARSAGKLRHPNIVTVFETGKTDDGVPFIVMDYIEGDSLDTVLKKVIKLEPVECIHYLAQLAAAIDYAHAQKVYHRDIKPSNVIVDRNYCPHLLDFGVAKVSDTSLTPVGTVVGTPSYMSPEQIRGSDEGGGTDIFALAVMSFEMLTGSRPFPGKDFVSVVANIIHRDPVSFSELNADLPPQLEQVLNKGLAKQKSDRYLHAMDLVSQIAHAFAVPIDTSGIAGGFRSGLKISDFVSKVQKVGTSSAVDETLLQEQNSTPTIMFETIKGQSKGGPGRTQSLKDIDPRLDNTSETPSLGKKKVGSFVVSKLPHKEPEGGRAMRAVSAFGVLLVSVSIGVLYFHEFEPSLPSHGVNPGLPTEISHRDGYGGEAEQERAGNIVKAADKSRVESGSPSLVSKPVSKPAPMEVKREINTEKNLKVQQYISLLHGVGPNPSEMREIMDFVKTTPDRELVLALSKWALKSSFSIRLQVLRILEDEALRANGVALAGLDAFIRDPDGLIRAKAAKIVGTFGSLDAIKILERRLGEEKDPLVLQMIREGLSRKADRL